jgi:alanine dehydrogenase
MIILSDQDVEKLLTMEEAIRAVESAFGELQHGKARMPTRSTIMIPEYNGSISFMPSYLGESGAEAMKIISIYPDNPKKKLPTTAAWIIVNDPKTGQIKAFMEASHLTAMRTGAVSGVAAKYLASKDANTLAIFGAGAQARTQVLAAITVRGITQIRIYDPIKSAVDRFAYDAEKRYGVDVIKASSGEEACKGADIVMTATTSRTPVINRSWLEANTHISAIGAFYPNYRELDTATIKEAKVVVDEWDAIRLEAGDILIPIQEGAITEAHIYATLGELVTGVKLGRTIKDGLTVFKSVGVAIQDSCVARIVLNKIVVGIS